MNDVLTQVTTWRGRGDRVALATVVDFRGSAPRPLGAKMALNSLDRGETALSILAEVVAPRHGRNGGRLQDARVRIHEVTA